MSGNGSRSTDLTSTSVSTTPQAENNPWHSVLVAFEVINILLLIVTCWVLLSMLVYGTRSGRWRKKAGSSSLNSGIVYTCCTVAVALFLPTITTTEILYHLKTIPNGLDWCEFACDMGNIAFSVSLIAAYFFIWLRLRLIYKHPYVKERVSQHANWFPVGMFIVLVLAGIGLACFYVIPGSYQATPYGCTHKPKSEGSFLQGSNRNILIAVVLISTQSLLICLAAYPVVRVKLEAHDDGENNASSMSKSFIKASMRFRKFVTSIRRGGGPTSPIELAVRRTLIGCIVMMLSDIIVLLPVVFIIPRDAPAQIRRTVYNIGAFVNIFCMITTFGYGIRVLTLFCAPLQKTRKFRSHRRGQVSSMSSMIKSPTLSQSSMSHV